MPSFESSFNTTEPSPELPDSVLESCRDGLLEAAEARQVLAGAIKRVGEIEKPTQGSQALARALMEAQEELYADESVLREYLAT